MYRVSVHPSQVREKTLFTTGRGLAITFDKKTNFTQVSFEKFRKNSDAWQFVYFRMKMINVSVYRGEQREDEKDLVGLLQIPLKGLEEIGTFFHKSSVFQVGGSHGYVTWERLNKY